MLEECLNKVELQGNIGRVSIDRFGGKLYAKIALATTRAFRDKNGNAVLETTWHNCSCFESNKIPSEILNKLDKGMAVNVKGRLHNVRLTEPESGFDYVITEIVANEISIIN